MDKIKWTLHGDILNAQNFFFHTNTHTELFALLITCVIDHTAQNHARHRSSAASVHRPHELGRLAAALLPIFCSQAHSDLCVGCQRSDEMKAGRYMSFQVVDCLSHSVSSSRSIALLEGKEYGTDLTH